MPSQGSRWQGCDPHPERNRTPRSTYGLRAAQGCHHGDRVILEAWRVVLTSVCGKTTRPLLTREPAWVDHVLGLTFASKVLPSPDGLAAEVGLPLVYHRTCTSATQAALLKPD